MKDFTNNSKYPGYTVYQQRFGSWDKGIIKSGIDISHRYFTYTDGELLEYLIEFFKETGKVPTMKDFEYSSLYPCESVYRRRFGSWNNSLKLANLDIDTLIKKGIIQNTYHKGRLFELCVLNSFRNDYVDLSGKNCISSFDGICPNGMIYDAKSASLMEGRYCYRFDNKEKEEIEIFYLGAFNKDFTILEHTWRIPGEFVENLFLCIGLKYERI